MDTDNILKEIRKQTLTAACMGGDANLQSIFSSYEIIWALYDRILDLEKIKDGVPDRDYFVCSKGQSALGHLIILAQKGIIEPQELEGYCGFHSRISMQADRTKFQRGIEVSAGSLGHGFPVAVGIAMSKKINQHGGKIIVLAGDGEMNEGTMWEACALASGRKLDNLYLIIDDNASVSEMIDFGDMAGRLRAFGFECVEADGHNVAEIEKAFLQLKHLEKPHALIAKTRRGYGSRTLMTKKEWFHKAPDKNSLLLLQNEIEEFDKEDAKNYVLME